MEKTLFLRLVFLLAFYGVNHVLIAQNKNDNSIPPIFRGLPNTPMLPKMPSQSSLLNSMRTKHLFEQNNPLQTLQNRDLLFRPNVDGYPKDRNLLYDRVKDGVAQTILLENRNNSLEKVIVSDSKTFKIPPSVK